LDAFAEHFKAGNECYERGELKTARGHFEHALALAPASVQAHYNLGVVYRDLELCESAWVEFIEVIARDARMAGAYNNLAILEERLELHGAAETHFRKAIALEEAFPDAQFNLGILLLRLGRFREGFAQCEWRWQTSRFTPFRVPHPRWDGSRLRGTLLVHSEQGAGDAMQFVRYLPMAAERCNRLLFFCPENLFPLFRSIPGLAELRAPGTVKISEFHAYIPLMSLPHVLGTTLETVPSRVPYLQPEPRSVDLGPPPIPNPRLKVGLAWAGSPTHFNDRHRSCTLRDLAPLFELSDVAFYSLQVGPRAGEVRDPESRPGIVTDLSDRQGDFADTAAAIEELDLTISVDTSVLHLAGALGRPVWGMISARSDWRWMIGRDNSPWYPTLRLFRQSRLDDWHEVFSRAAAALSSWAPGRENVAMNNEDIPIARR